MTGASVIKQLCQLSLGGPAVGLAFGLVVVFWLRFIYNDDMVSLLQFWTPLMTLHPHIMPRGSLAVTL